MQIIIPMSGFGERFRRAGYDVPKPLIKVDGKPIIAHVVDMFPGETDFVFICNRDHLAEPRFRMAEILREIAPKGRIVPIAPHKLGPVNAVLMARDAIDPNRPAIVNYCDFTCYWDYEDFKRFVTETDSLGCIPAYRGFHPHSLGSTFYAYMRHTDLWVENIQEKQPFTPNPTDEFASSGTYYFRSGRLCLESFEAQVAADYSVNGEFYVSLAYKVLLENNHPVSIYELQHFMQWGTPDDLLEYQNWSNTFRQLATSDGRRARHRGAVLLPMAGLGKRFADEGYTQPKPLVPVSGRPMVIQALRDLPDTPAQRFVLRLDLPGAAEIEKKLRSTFVGAQFHVLSRLTEGQAVSCLLGMDGLNPTEPLTIGACDNGVLYDVGAFEQAMSDGLTDVLVWTVRGHADGRRRPEMFGWVEVGPDGVVTGVRVKSRPDAPTTDPLIIGAFTFKKASDFEAAAKSLLARDGRVNGEFYVDSLIEDCIAAGLTVKIFEVTAYIGWGTPTDLRTFEYWQSCFQKWPSHPYTLQNDRRIPTAAVPSLLQRYAKVFPARPHAEGTTQTAPTEAAETFRQALRFVPMGALTVGIDLLIYAALVAAGAGPSTSKIVSFIVGACFAFFANRHFTFRARGGSSAPFAFAAVYASSLVLNVVVNWTMLHLTLSILERPFALFVAWFAATAVSASANFLGMKFLVFREVSAR